MIADYTNHPGIFSQMIEELQDYAIMLLDPDGIILNWNKGASLIKGYGKDEIIGKSFKLFFAEEDRKNKKPERLLKTAARKGRVQDEGWHLRKDGMRFWGNTTITALRNEEGKLQGFTKVTQDFTERKMAENVIEKVHNAISEVKDYAIVLLSNKGIIENWNKGARRIKGYRSDEVIGKCFNIFYVGKDQASQKPERLLEIARRWGRAADEGWRVRKDGSTFWGSTTITAIHDGKANVTGFIKVTRDLTERKVAESTIEKMHKAISEVGDFAIILLDKGGKIEDWNTGATRILGYKAEEILGQCSKMFYTEEDRNLQKPERLIEKAAIKGLAKDEGWRVRKDGSTFWASAVITAVHDANDNVIGFTNVTRDLTERKMVEVVRDRYAKKLEVKNKELEQFAYIASHDLQEPLRTITSMIERLATKYSQQLDGQGMKMMQYVTEASIRMRDLIKGLLDYSRLGRDAELVDVNCTQLARAVEKDLALAIEESNATLHIHSLPIIKGYKTELRLLFQNLINNALKFRKKSVPPEIHIYAEEFLDFWQFKFQDNGIGMDPKYTEKIFLIFQRLHARKAYEGTGIGLAHCRKIVHLHGGKIWVYAQPGKGSTFYFTIIK